STYGRAETRRNERETDARDGDREGDEGVRGGDPALRREDVQGDGGLQRGPRRGGHHARRGGPEAEQGRQAGQVLREQPDRHRRSVRGDQGTDRGLLALAGEVDGGGGEVGEALPQPHADRVGDRDPPALRDRRLRRSRPLGRDPQAGGRAPQEDRGAAD